MQINIFKMVDKRQIKRKGKHTEIVDQEYLPYIVQCFTWCMCKSIRRLLTVKM